MPSKPKSADEVRDLSALINELDELVTTAQTSPDRKVKTKAIVEALKKACLMMKKLNRVLKPFAEEIWKRLEFERPHESLAFRDFVEKHEELEVFRSEAALMQFLNAAEPLLVAQMHVSKAKVHEIALEIRNTYDLFMDQEASVSHLLVQCQNLERMFCRPPYDGGLGTPLLDGDPKNGPSGARAETARKWVVTVTSVGTLLLELAKVIVGASAQARQINDTDRLGLLAVLVLSGYSLALNNSGQMPSQEAELEQPQTAGKKKKEDRIYA